MTDILLVIIAGLLSALVAVTAWVASRVTEWLRHIDDRLKQLEAFVYDKQ